VTRFKEQILASDSDLPAGPISGSIAGPIAGPISGRTPPAAGAPAGAVHAPEQGEAVAAPAPPPSSQSSINLGELTSDQILRGRLTLLQPRVGYRFSIDPLLLADFVGPAPLGNLVDLGAGVGVVGLTLGKNDPAATLTLVELQPRLAALCGQNAAANGLADRCTVIQGDLLSPATQKQLPGACFDLVVSCPPYYPLGQGGVNPDSEEAIARHELRLPLPDLVRAARRLIGFRGRFAVVYPSPRLSELLAQLLSCGLQPTRLRLVHPHPGEPAQRALVEARKGGRGGLHIEPPLYVRDASGQYTQEARRALGESS
jgi:tRNA1Val (adenine37-N6)-methyltransferase